MPHSEPMSTELVAMQRGRDSALSALAVEVCRVLSMEIRQQHGPCHNCLRLVCICTVGLMHACGSFRHKRPIAMLT